MKLFLLHSAVLLALCAVPDRAVAGMPAASQSDQPKGVTTVRQPGAITGTALQANDTPIPEALLRLRDVTSGRIVARTQADGAGRFIFAPVAPGTYVVELVNEEGRVLAVGQTLNMSAGGTVATAVKLGAQAGWSGRFFTNVAAAVIATASSLGVTGVSDGAQPASARQ